MREVLQETEQCQNNCAVHASTHGPEHPREVRFPSGEGEPNSIPRPASPAVVTASALGRRVCPSMMVMPWGSSTGSSKRWDHRELVSYSSTGRSLSICSLRITKPHKHSHGWKVLLLKTLHNILYDFLVEDCKIQTFFLMELLERFLRVSKAV